MSVFVKVNGREYPATVDGRVQDNTWDGRASKTIHLSVSAAEAKELFADDTPWSIVVREIDTVQKLEANGEPVLDEESNPVMEDHLREEEYDNSEYAVAGDVIDHRDGTCSVKMGKPTDLEEAYELLYGGEA